MPYLIDGHNLIGRLPDISLDDPNDEAKLVQKLIGFVAKTRKKVTVVFDQGLPGGYSTMSTNSVKVIFAASRQTTADRVLMERIRNTKDTGNWTVITSDQVILDTAQRSGMKIMRSAEFARLLEKPAPKREKRGEAPDVYVSPQEVDEWLAIFSNRKKQSR